MPGDPKKLAVIAPCFNEGGNIPRLVERVGKALAGIGRPFELVLIDDASLDNTWEKIRVAARAHQWIVPVQHEKNQGIVGGWHSGLAATDAALLVTIDADMQYRPEDIPLLVETLEKNGADFAQGRRETQVKRGALRRLLTAGLSLFLNLVFGMRLRDIKSGFVCYTREAMTDILDYRRPFRFFQHFIAVAAHSLGYRIVQIPVVFDQREAGKSFITRPFRFSLQALPDIPRALMEYRFRPRARKAS